jgi:chromosomal replication initiator protein
MYRFVRALRSRDTIGFKQMFRSVDVLMVDDVQFIAGKDSTQEEFFHTFNALVDQGKQIIISADRAPVRDGGARQPHRLPPAMRPGRRHPPDRLRAAPRHPAAQGRAHARPQPRLEIADGVLEFIAHRISSNVRVLEGALTRLFAFGSCRKDITMELAQDCLADILRAPTAR